MKIILSKLERKKGFKSEPYVLINILMDDETWQEGFDDLSQFL